MPRHRAQSSASRWLVPVLLLSALAGVWLLRGADRAAAPAASVPGAAEQAADGAARADLPPEAFDTLRLIRAGGPFLHRQDDGVFGNRERLLPARPRGWYREYTVRTPGARDRGARRIVTGGRPPSEFFYSDDHYRSFRRIDAEAGRAR